MSIPILAASTLDRRTLLQVATAGTAGLLLPVRSSPLTTRAQVEMIPELVIDLASEPATLDPIYTYSPDGWSIVHAIYDSPIQYSAAGETEMLAAQALTFVDDLTLDVTLRAGLLFHDGSVLTSESIVAGIEAILASDSQIKGNFGSIESVAAVDDSTARLTLSRPSPWLPAQIAVWLTCVSPADIAAGDVADRPNGTGPYRFVSWQRGVEIVLAANPAYPVESPKGRPIAETVRFRFVGDASTRVTNLLAGASDIVRSVPVDQAESIVEGTGEVITQPLSGTAFLRVPTDVAPFSDVRVRRALNHAVDVQAIIDTLLGGNGRRLANLFVPNGLGFDEALAPYAYDPDRARALLAEAGLDGGFETRLAYATSERKDLLEAIAAMLGEVGVDVELVPQEIATFNGEWTDAEAPPLRFVTWRPMVDPFNLINLMITTPGPTGGFLSRHANPDLQTTIDAAASETDPTARAARYRELGVQLHEQPAAVYLWDLTALYGVSEKAAAWTPRPDDYIIPTRRA